MCKDLISFTKNLSLVYLWGYHKWAQGKGPELYTLCHISSGLQGEFHPWIIYIVLQNSILNKQKANKKNKGEQIWFGARIQSWAHFSPTVVTICISGMREFQILKILEFVAESIAVSIVQNNGEGGECGGFDPKKKYSNVTINAHNL